MNGSLLVNCLLYEEVSLDDLAGCLNLDTGRLFGKIIGDENFTPAEIKTIVGRLGLTKEETDAIFFSP